MQTPTERTRRAKHELYDVIAACGAYVGAFSDNPLDTSQIQIGILDSKDSRPHPRI
ncbi:MAG: hypothetical protein V3U04_07210 [Candidatus Aerophobetes bacterium]